MKILAPAFSTLALASVLSVVPAQAATLSNAVESCQGSLPNFEGALRKRPLAVSNEGTSTAFVSCSMAKILGSPSGITAVYGLFTNRTGAPVSISCTLVDGYAGPGAAPVYLPKTLSVAANNYATLFWTSAADNGGIAFVLANLNCALPAGTEINAVQT